MIILWWVVLWEVWFRHGFYMEAWRGDKRSRVLDFGLRALSKLCCISSSGLGWSDVMFVVLIEVNYSVLLRGNCYETPLTCSLFLEYTVLFDNILGS